MTEVGWVVIVASFLVIPLKRVIYGKGAGVQTPLDYLFVGMIIAGLLLISVGTPCPDGPSGCIDR